MVYLSKVMSEARNHMEEGSRGTTGDFLCGAVYMAELFANGQGALRETLEAIRNDLRLLDAMDTHYVDAAEQLRAQLRALKAEPCV